jgi:hypothetical protein
MAWLKDRLQDAAIEALTEETFQTEVSLIQKVAHESRRNDVQTARIKALAAAIEGLSGRLVAAGLLPAEDVRAELAALRDAMKPSSSNAQK